MPGLLLTHKEAAERLGICQKTLLKLVVSGKISYVLVNRRRRYTQAALDAFLSSEARTTEADQAKRSHVRVSIAGTGDYSSGRAKRLAEREMKRSRRQEAA
jgi:excisionase family DNA binding protein